MASPASPFWACSRSAQHVFSAMKSSAGFLPLASFIILSGITASLLPSFARFVLPPLHSSLLVFMPQLWNALLCWLTPPCLFLLLNGIILILALTSGILKNSGAGGSDFYAEFLVRMETRQKQQMMEPLLLNQQPTKTSKETSKETVKEIMEPPLNHQPSKASEQIIEAPSLNHQAETLPNEQLMSESAVAERPFKKTPSTVSSHEMTVAAGVYGRSKSDVSEKTESEIPTPHIKRRRSQSVDSSALERSSSSSNLIVVEVPPPDKLSDEDLKRRIDDFISRFNAQIRRESLKSNGDQHF